MVGGLVDNVKLGREWMFPIDYVMSQGTNFLAFRVMCVLESSPTLTEYGRGEIGQEPVGNSSEDSWGHGSVQ